MPDLTQSLRLPKGLLSSRNGKHSDLTLPLWGERYGNGRCCGFSPPFPYPRTYRRRSMSDNRQKICRDEPCLFFCRIILTHEFLFFKSYFAKYIDFFLTLCQNQTDIKLQGSAGRYEGFCNCQKGKKRIDSGHSLLHRLSCGIYCKKRIEHGFFPNDKRWCL